MFVFGSFVKGDYTPGSDLDILLVLSDSNLSFRERIPVYYPRNFPVSVDLFPYTEAELKSDLPVYQTAVKTGIEVVLR